MRKRVRVKAKRLTEKTTRKITEKERVPLGGAELTQTYQTLKIPKEKREENKQKKRPIA